ncbi:hypothetical protein BD626DRAFT_567734 [Schizophyllum amplum]|uniref:Uncharacterized protein n=1 Tax=Schizophyllum amplum TaxID=97359 RepID=A0A550CJB3_9AGAR|nr:hypothetical protein BD626DRAFT_567734 [Auriculariopsis ampla]
MLSKSNSTSNLPSLFRKIFLTARRPSATISATPAFFVDDFDSTYDFSLDRVDARAGLGLGHPSSSSLNTIADPVVVSSPQPDMKKKKKGIFGLSLFSRTPASPVSTVPSAFASAFPYPSPLDRPLYPKATESPVSPSHTTTMSRAAAHTLRPASFPRRFLYAIPEELPSPCLDGPSPRLGSPLLGSLPRHRGPLLVFDPITDSFSFYRSPLLGPPPSF